MKVKTIILKLLLICCLVSCNSSDNKEGTIFLSCCSPNSYVVEVNTIGEDIAIDVFNVITPNGDYINDNFVIGGLAQYPDNYLKIFYDDELIFQSANYHLAPFFGSDLINDAFSKKVFTYELLIDAGNSFKARGSICAVKTSGNNQDNCNLFDIYDPLFN